MFYNEYEEFYDMAEKSNAFRAFCGDAFGEDFSQDGFSDIKQIDQILQYVPSKENVHVLDIGCGNGKMLNYLQKKTGAFIHGFDYSEKAIRTACKLFPVNSEFREGVIGEIEYPKESFDVITSMSSKKKWQDISMWGGRLTKMLKLYTPKYEDLWFRQMFMADEETMSYNHAWGGTIAFPEETWETWYDDWIVNPEGKRFYRYLVNEKEFVGEIAYHYDDMRRIHVADVIVYAKYRGNGYGKQGLQLLCEAAKANGIRTLYDDIAIDNAAIRMFLENGFREEYRMEDIIMLKKEL